MKHTTAGDRGMLMGIFVVLVLLLASGTAACSRTPKGRLGAWWQLNPDPTVAGTSGVGGFDVLDVQVVDENCIVAVGTKGMFLRSTSFGNVWMPVNTGKGTLRAVYFLDCDTGYIAGDADGIFKTTNGGVTWENTLEFRPDLAPGNDWHINDLYFSDGSNGVAVGKGSGWSGLVLWTNDGAETWSWNIGGKWLRSIDFANQQVGIAVGGLHFDMPDYAPSALRTESGITGVSIYEETGYTQYVGWENLEPKIREGLGDNFGYFDAIEFLNENTVYVAGGVFSPDLGHGIDGIFESPDAGDTWSDSLVVSSWDFASPGFSDLSYPLPSEGTLVGAEGIIVHHSVSSDTFTIQPSGTEVTLSSVDFLNTDLGVVGGYGNTILTTKDGGSTWQGPRSATTRDLLTMTGLSDGFIAAVGDYGAIVVSEDNGETWVRQFLGWPYINYRFYDIAFSSSANGIAVGINGVVVRTSDGSNWINLDGSIASGYLYGVVYCTPTKVVVVGDDVLAVSESSGLTWDFKTLPPDAVLRDVECIDSDLIIAVGYEGRIVRSEDGGETWTFISSPNTAYLTEVFLLDSQQGWAVGYDGAMVGGTENPNPRSTEVGIILHTEDGGLTWTEQTSGTALALWDIAFIDQNIGIAVGGKGTSEPNDKSRVEGIILVTSDGGSTWQAADLPSLENLRGVYVAPDGQVYIAGTRGFIARADDLLSLFP